MKKVVVTLDPEYIPWDPGVPAVRLRRKRNKRLAAILGVGFAVLACGGVLWFGYLGVGGRDKTPALPTPVVAEVVELSTPAAQPTIKLITQGRPGALALVRNNVAVFLECNKYVVRLGDQILSQGETGDGPVVQAVYEVMVECDGETFKY